MLQKLWKRFFTREMILYLVFGVLTTLINLAVYQFFYAMVRIPNLIANVLAWIVSVIFAYITNNRIVFADPFTDWEREWKKITMFLGARIFSLVVDEAGMWIFVDLCRFGSMWSKLGMNVIVVILNYIFSKFFIFTKEENKNRKRQKEKQPEKER